jgi:hypothetical protein
MAPPETSIVVELAQDDQKFEELGFRPGLQRAWLDWPGVGEFWVAEGTRIVVRPASGVTTEELALVTAGSVLALLLEQRGYAVLHGSCVELDGQATALLGPSGAGKSTLAASLREQGAALISDGMTVVDLSGDVPLALPGPPHLKLWPDAIASLAPAASAGTRPVARQEDKRWYEAQRGRATRAVPLTRAFVLEPGATVGVARFSPAAALVALVQNYFLADFADGSAREFMLKRCAPLAASVSVSTLRRGSSLNDVGAVIALLRT